MRSLSAFCVTEKVSGGELYLLRLLGALKERGWDIYLIGGPNEELERAARTRGLRYVVGRLGPKLGTSTAVATATTFLRQMREMRRLVRAVDADVILLQYKLEQLLAGGRLQASKTVVLEHGPIPRALLRTPVMRQRYLRTLSEARHCFAASAVAQESLHALGYASTLLPAGVDVVGATKPPPGAKIGLFAGRLEANKGVLAAIKLTLRSEGFKLVIAGSGTLASDVEALALRYPDRLKFVGEVAHVDELIQTSDFGMLLSSDPGEGRPLFALECAARGRPVIASQRSPAMRSLAMELAPGSIVLYSDRQIAEGCLPSAGFPEVKPYAVEWTDTARQFERTLGA